MTEGLSSPPPEAVCENFPAENFLQSFRLQSFTSKLLLAGHDLDPRSGLFLYNPSLFRSVATKKRTIAPPEVVAQAATGPSFLLTKKGGKDVPKGVPPLGIPPLCREGAPFATLTSAQRHKLRRTAQVLR